MNFISLLTLLFVGLKLTNYIEWSWFWVLSPTIFQVLFTVFVLVGAFIVALRK